MTVQPSDVADVLGSTDLSNPQLQSFIDMAGRWYDPLVSGENVPTETRDDVVTLLAAHIIRSSPERAISSAGEGGGNVSFEGNHEKTPHWELATSRDPTGKLATSDKPSASVSVPDVKGIDD